jgi:biotin carboxyl carrier protein
VVAVNVDEGQAVGPGDVLVTLESMKMEHRVRAAGAATVTAVHVTAGDFVEAGTVLMSLCEPGNSP